MEERKLMNTTVRSAAQSAHKSKSKRESSEDPDDLSKIETLTNFKQYMIRPKSMTKRDRNHALDHTLLGPKRVLRSKRTYKSNNSAIGSIEVNLSPRRRNSGISIHDVSVG